jgi:type II secretory pathway component PulC
VRRNAVLIDNGGQKEILRREGDEEGLSVARAPSGRAQLGQGRPVVQQSGQQTIVSREAVVRELEANAATLLTQVKPEFKKDARGNTVGVTSSNISAIPIAKEIGLQDNDVVTSINGEKIDSQEKLFALFNKYGNAATVRVGIERNGRPQVLNLRLE